MWILCWHWLGAMFQSMINISQIFFPLRLFVLLVLCSEQQNRCTLSNPDKTEFNTMQFSHLVGSKLTHYCLNGCRNVFEQNFACSQPIKIMIKCVFFPIPYWLKSIGLLQWRLMHYNATRAQFWEPSNFVNASIVYINTLLKKSRYYRFFEIRWSHQQNQ